MLVQFGFKYFLIIVQYVANNRSTVNRFAQGGAKLHRA
jgi:hypothetical protein